MALDNSVNIPLLNCSTTDNQDYNLNDVENGDVRSNTISSNDDVTNNINEPSDNRQCSLNNAVRKNDITKAKRLISEGADPHFLLLDAAEKGYFEKCENLLGMSNIKENGLLNDENDININVLNNEGLTALHLAAKHEHLEVIDVLLRYGASVSVTDKSKCIPLHYAADEGFLEGFKKIMERSSPNCGDVNKKNKNGKSPFMLAAAKGHLSCCEVIDNPDLNIKDKVQNTVLHLAAAAGSENTLSWILSKNTEPSTLEAKNDKDFTPILAAARNGHLKVVKILEKKGADICKTDKRKQNILHMASFGKNSDLMEYLLNMESQEIKNMINAPDKERKTPLITALEKKSLTCAMILIQNGASGSLFPEKSDSPLHLAAFNGYTGIVKLLLAQKGIQVNAKNQNDDTPLHMAARNKSYDSKNICDLLLENGAGLDKMNTTKKQRNTKERVIHQAPLHAAAELGNINSLRPMAWRRKKLLLQDGNGDTALHLATKAGSIDCCRVLLEAETSTNTTKNKDGKYACQVAFETKHYDIFKFLMIKLPLSEEKERKKLMFDIHSYVHETLNMKNEGALENEKSEPYNILEGIVKSKWWFAGFSNEDCCCRSFNVMCEKYPKLAKIVQDKCITKESNQNSTYNFEIYEGLPPTSGGMEHNITSSWMKHHPLTILSEDKVNDSLLMHKLTKAWIISRWKGYIWKLFTVLILFQTLLAFILTIHLKMAWNWDYILHNQTNVTQEEICSEWDTNYSKKILKWLFVRQLLWYTLWLLLSIDIALVINYTIKAKSFDKTMISLRWLQVVLILAFITPVSAVTKCSIQKMIISEYSWKAGFAAVMLTWMLLIKSLNTMPVLNVFMPLTNQFLTSFAKILLHFFIIISTFALVFNLLIYEDDAFRHWPQAFIKTLTWMLGDLSYDSTFVEMNPQYRWFANLFFVIFIFTMAVFLSNMVVTLPSNSFEDFRKKASVLKLTNCIKMIFILDICFPCIRKWYNGRQNSLYKYEDRGYASRFLLMDMKNEISEEENTQNELKDLKKKINMQTEAINKLNKNKHEEKNEISEEENTQKELKDLKKQICMLTETIKKLVENKHEEKD